MDFQSQVKAWQCRIGGVQMSKAHRKFVETVFEMETDLRGTIIKRLGFHLYLIQTEAGEQIQFKC